MKESEAARGAAEYIVIFKAKRHRLELEIHDSKELVCHDNPERKLLGAVSSASSIISSDNHDFSDVTANF